MTMSERPEEDELLSYLDGELLPERQAEIQRLLEADWSLRAELGKLERRIEKFVDATAHQLPPAPPGLPPAEAFWRNLSPELDRLAANHAARQATASNEAIVTSSAPDWWARLFGEPRWTMALAAGLLAVVAAAFYLFAPRGVRPVSAEEMLRRSAEDEIARPRQVAEPVVYRRLQARRRTAQGESAISWEVWSGATRAQFRQRVADEPGQRGLQQTKPALLAELERILEQNHFDARQPLSAAVYRQWRNQVPRQTESMVEIAGGGLRLTTIVAGPHARDAVRAASLVVRRADWHAVALQLQVQGEHETRNYELNETAYEVLPAAALTIFTDAPPTPAPAKISSPTLIPLASPPAKPAHPAHTEADLQEAEVAALYVLHQLRADRHGQIEIVRAANGRLVARGLVETADEKQRLHEALSRLPLVTTQLQTIAEASARSAPAPVTIITPEGATATDAPSANAFAQRLARAFAERGEAPEQVRTHVARLANAVVSESNAALAEAWALRRLAERFAAERRDELSPTAQPLLAEMKRNHLARLRAHSRALRTQLEPVLHALAGAEAAVPTAPPDASGQPAPVFKAVEQARQLIHQLFAGAGFAAQTPEQSARRLLAALAQLDGALAP